MKLMKFLLKTMIVLVIIASIYVASETYMQQYQYKEIKVSHILLDTKEDAENVKERLNNGEVFEELVQERSLCPTKSVNGNLGWISKNNKFDKEFSKTIFSMKKGHVSEPIHSDFGWHIVRIDDVRK